MRCVALIVVAVLAAGESSAQIPGRTARERNVRAVVDSFFAAVEREQWDSAAAFVDASRFGEYVKLQVREARSYVPPRPVTVEDLMAQDSTLPRAVAEWQVAQSRKAEAVHRPFPVLGYEFAGIDSPQQLADLSTTQALARWIQATDERVQTRELAKQAGCPEAISSVLPFAKVVIRAVAFPGDTTAYVIVGREGGMLAEDSTFNGERILRLRLRGGTWRLAPRQDLLNQPGMAMSGVSCDRRK